MLTSSATEGKDGIAGVENAACERPGPETAAGEYGLTPIVINSLRRGPTGIGNRGPCLSRLPQPAGQTLFQALVLGSSCHKTRLSTVGPEPLAPVCPSAQHPEICPPATVPSWEDHRLPLFLPTGSSSYADTQRTLGLICNFYFGELKLDVEGDTPPHPVVAQAPLEVFHHGTLSVKVTFSGVWPFPVSRSHDMDNAIVIWMDAFDGVVT